MICSSGAQVGTTALPPRFRFCEVIEARKLIACFRMRWIRRYSPRGWKAEFRGKVSLACGGPAAKAVFLLARLEGAYMG